MVLVFVTILISMVMFIMACKVILMVVVVVVSWRWWL